MAKKIKKEEIILKRSNNLIQAKYASSLMEKKLVALAMSRLRLQDNELIAVMSANEIREALNYNGNSLYTELKTLSAQSLQHYLFLEDDKLENKFDAIAVITRATYKNGYLVFTFNKEIKKHTLDVERKYTLTPLSTLLSFKSNNTYRIYENLMLHYYKIPDSGVYEVSYGLSELKFTIGLIDTNQKDVAKALEAGMSYDDILDTVVKDPPYKTYSNFKVRVLERARTEMLDSPFSEISFEYKPITRGRGGRTIGIRFFIKKQHIQKNGRPPLEKEQMNITDEDVAVIMEYSNGQLTNRNAVSLLLKSNNNVTLIKRIFDQAMKQGNIKNLMGWMLAAIGEDWDFDDMKSIAPMQNFTERTNSYEEIQKQLFLKNIPDSGDYFDLTSKVEESEEENSIESDMVKLSELDPEIQDLIKAQLKKK